MNSQEAQSLLPDLCTGCLDAKTEKMVREWLEKCPDCQAEWHSLHSTLFVLSTSTQPLLSEEQSRQMWQRCAEQLYDRIEADRVAQQRSSGWLGWFQMQPRWGWAALGGAVAVLGGVWFLAPQNAPGEWNDAPRTAAVSAADTAGFVSFRRPPREASTLVNHHSAMSIDPFTDHVGTTLVSYSASAPQ